jgi:glycosyltransferase involved in cell wall biosynthesis
MDLSIIVPLFNEEESLPELTEWIRKVMEENHFSYEILLVDDGSSDKSWEVINSLAVKNSNIHGIKFRRNYGKSAALNIGFENAGGDVVITMDADLQDSPEEIPELYRMIKEQGNDLVSGWKKKRYDPLSKTIPTRFFNWATRKMSGLKLHDFNCGLKAYRKEVVKCIEVYGEMHRYIPVIVNKAGFHKIVEKIVLHQKRKYGSTKFGFNRFINGFLDLLTVSFITKFRKRPMHFFGVWGTLMFLTGGIVAIWLICEKVYFSLNNLVSRKVTEMPLFYIALVLVIIGVQLFLAGFLAELISRSSSDRNTYLIEKTI